MVSSTPEAQRARAYRAILKEYVGENVYFQFVDYIERGTPGMCYRNKLGWLCIELKRGLGDALEREIFVHELWHALCRDPDELAAGTSRGLVEAEAEVMAPKLLQRLNYVGAFDDLY